MSVALVWFRRDLRLADHAALAAALAGHDRVIPVYVHAPEEEAPWEPGAASQWWLRASVAALDAALRAQGSRLLTLRGPSLAALARIAQAAGARAVYCHRLYEPALRTRDLAVAAGLAEQGIELHALPGALLAEPEALVNRSGQPYRVYTPFWRALHAQMPPPRPLPAPTSLKPPGRWPAAAAWESIAPRPEAWSRKFERHWTPGEAAARRLLSAFASGPVGGYAQARDFPADAGTSRLSPALHFGELSPRQLWHALGNQPPGAGTEAFLRQIGWREFAHHVLYHFPESAERPMDERFARFRWRRNHGALLEAWQRGRTGVPIVDAGMRQLWATGWMHNRVRMLVASYLVKNLRIPWQEGARWFWDTLVDADLANNSMGWQWCAGCGLDAAPYFRIFNPVGQSAKFDPDGAYLRRWVPELKRLPARWLHSPWELPESEWAGTVFVPGRDYPLPQVDLERSRDEALEAFRRLGRR